MEILARPAIATDLDALVALAEAAVAELSPQRGGRVWRGQQARREPRRSSLLADLHDPERLLLVGTIDKVVVGYASARTETMADGARLGVVDELMVDEAARAVGVGEALLEACLHWCRAAGCTGVDAFALPGARETKNFFETAGFTARLLVVHRPLDDA